MYHDGKHVCMLKKIPPRPCIRPLEGWFRRRWCNLRSSMLACPWHHSSKVCLRSEYGIDRERERQMNSKWWMIMHPYSAMRFFWDCFLTMVYMLSLLYIPLQVFIKCPNRYDPYILFADAIGFLAIGINFNTGCVIEDGKKVGLEPLEIATRYLKDTFVFDLISALPLQCVVLDDNCQFPTYTILYLLKLFRVKQFGYGFKKLCHQFHLPYVTLVMLTVLQHVWVFFHWMTFCNYQVPLYFKYVYPQSSFKLDNWLRRVKAIKVENEEISCLEKYIINLYYVTGLCIGAGVFSLVEPNSQMPEQQVLNAIIGIIGLLFITYTFTTLLLLVVYRHYEIYLYNAHLKELSEYLEFKKVPKYLLQKIKLYINYRFNGHHFNEKSILNTINVQIKQEINMFYCKKLVFNVPLFQNMPIALINTIIFSLIQVLYMPGEVVVKYGKPGSSLYLIASGTVAIMNAEGKEVGHLKDGAFFGERALLRPGTPRSATIVALEITEIYKLNHLQLQACLQPCPRLKRRLVEETFQADRRPRVRHGNNPNMQE